VEQQWVTVTGECFCLAEATGSGGYCQQILVDNSTNHWRHQLYV
jgi:hypothetical protein